MVCANEGLGTASRGLSRDSAVAEHKLRNEVRVAPLRSPSGWRRCLFVGVGKEVCPMGHGIGVCSCR